MLSHYFADIGIGSLKRIGDALLPPAHCDEFALLQCSY